MPVLSMPMNCPARLLFRKSDRREPYACELHFMCMKQTLHNEYVGTRGIGALGLCVTILASVIAFLVAGAGMFDGPSNVKKVSIEKT